MGFTPVEHDPFQEGSGGAKFTPVDHDPFGETPEKKPSYLEAAKVGLKEGLAGAMRMYEIPSRTILEKTGLGAPGTFASELLKPSEEESKRVGELGIPGELVRGAANLPGAFAKYGPMMAAAPAGVVGTGLTFAGEKAAEDLAAGKKISPVELGEEAVIGGIFRGIEPLGRLARMAILSGTFSTQAFADAYAQTKDIKQALKAAIAPSVIGAGMGAMGGGKKGERPIPRPGEGGEPLQIPTIPESRYQMGPGGYPRPEELPHPIVPYKPGGPMVDTGQFFQATSVPPRPEPTREIPFTPTGTTTPPTPDWVKEGRVQPPPQYPPAIFEPKPQIRPSEAIKPPIPAPPAPTPPPAVKGPEAPIRPLPDAQMGIIRTQADKVGGLSVDLIKRWTGVGTKRANAALEGLVNSGEVVGAEPGQKFPWKFKTPAKPEADPELSGTIRELQGIIKIGQPGFKGGDPIFPGETISAGTSQAIEAIVGMKGVSRAEALEAIEKGLNGEEFKTSKKRREAGIEPKQKEIWDSINGQAKGIIEDRKANDEMDRVRSEMAKEDLMKEDLTNHIDDEIMGLKEELRENHSDAEISRAIEEATKNIPPEGAPPDISAIETEIRSLLAPKVEPPPEIPKVEGIKYDAVQDLSQIGEPEQYQFTELKTGSTFSVPKEGLTEKNLEANRERIRKAWENPPRPEDYGLRPPANFDAELKAAAKKIAKPGETLEENLARTKDWISSVLTNDEASTDGELVDYFQKEGGLSKEIAEYIVSKRSQVKELPLGVKKEMKEPAISKLRQSAESLTKQIEDRRHPAVAQQNVTARRAKQVDSAYAMADRLENLQNKLNALADAHESGTVPESLSKVTTKSQLETILNRSKFPRAYLHKEWIKDILEATKGKPGTAADREILSRVRLREENGGSLYGEELEVADRLIKVAEKAGVKSPWAKENIAENKRMANAGIDTEEKFQQAKKDISELGQKPIDRSQEQKIRTAEQNLLGRKIPGYFPTPKATAEALVEAADIRPGMTVLEPSAGKGNIADVIKEQIPDADLKTIEWQSELSKILKLKGYDVIGDDFLKHTGQYDRIVMNPPFENFQDIDHTRHAYDLLKPGGKVVSIMSESPFFRQDKKAVAFREWLDSVDGTSEKLPEKSFAKKSERATGVSGRMVIIDKPELPPPSPTRAGEQLLPGMGVGTMFPTGAKEGAAPTLEGTPLAEAARKAEIEKMQPKLGIGDSVVGNTPQGDFKGVVAEVNPDGSVLIGAPDGKMVELPADKVSSVGMKLAVKAGDQAPMTGLEEYMTAQGVSVENIPKELLGGADLKDVKVGYVDTEGKFTEIPKPGIEPPSTGESGPTWDAFLNEKVSKLKTKTLYDLTNSSEGRRRIDKWREEFQKSKEKPEARMGETPKEPLSRESVQGFTDERLKILKNAPETEILDTIADMPERLSSQLEENMRNGIKGVYDPMSKKIYLIREMLGSEDDVIKTVEHEAVGHYATEAFLGKESEPFYNRVYMKYGRSGLKDIADERGFDLNTREGRIDAAKEKIAQLAEAGENPGLLKQLYAWIREQVRKIFPDLKISDAEIQSTIAKARDTLIRGDFAAREAKIDALKRQVAAVTGLSPQERFAPAQFSLAGKAKETGRAAYEEEIKPAGKGLWGIWEGIKKTVSPTSGVDVKDMDVMMKLLGEREMAKTRVEYLTERGIAEINKLSPAEQVDFIDKVQSGRFNEIPENLRYIATLHRSLEDSLFDRANAILQKSDSASQIHYLRDHVRNFWKVVPRGLEDEIQKKGFEGLSRRPLEGTRAPLHHQYWTLKEGMANGGVPFTTNLLEATRLNYADTYKLITAHDMWNAIGEIGHRKFVKFGEVVPEGFRHLDDRIANKYFPPKEAGRWVVEDNVGRILENYLSRDLVRENPALRGIMGIKNVTTALELGFSAFHASFITWETIASQIGLGMRKIWNQGMIKEGLKDILEAPISPYKTFKMGQDIVRLFKTPEEFMASTGGQEFFKTFPEAKEMLGDLFWGGGSLRMSESYRINSLNTFKENMNSKNYIGAALRSIPALSQVMMKPLFETYIPSLKRAVFFKEFSNELIARQADLLSGKITRPELARNIWSFVENRFGEMSFDNLWWKRTFKSGLQLGVRSVTWKLGNIRAYGKAVTGQSTELLAALREGRMPKLTQEMAWFWGLAATTAAMASIAQYAFTGKAPENWKDMIYPQIDNQGGRLSLPTYMRDFFSATHSPVKYVSSSLAGWFGRFLDIVGNKDFYGVQVHDPNENIIQQRVDDLIHLAPLPFSIQSMKRFREEGEPVSRQVAGFLGATKAPYWIERTDAEQKASDLKAAHLPSGGRTAADFERGNLLKNYAKKYQEASLKGESTDEVMRQLHSDIATGKLQMHDLLRFRQRISKEPLIQSVANLQFRDILEVWNVASTEEKKKLYPILNKKYYGLRSPEDRALYFSKIRQIAEEMRQ